MILKDTHYIEEFSKYYIPGVEKVIIRSVLLPGLTEEDLFSFEYDHEDYNFDVYFNLAGQVYKVIKYESAEKEISRTYIFEYDSLGRPTSFTELYGDEAKHNLTSTITYDDKDRVVAKKQFSRGLLGSNDEEVNISYTYDGEKEIIIVSQNGIIKDHIIRSSMRDKNGDITKIMYYDASGLPDGFIEFTHDPENGLILSQISRGADNKIIWERLYSYDKNNDLITQIYRTPDYSFDWRYEYDYASEKIWSDKFCYFHNKLMLITNRRFEG